MTKLESKEWVFRARAEHHKALEAMANNGLSGIAIWRKLRKLECEGNRLGLQLCNGPELSEDKQEQIKEHIRAGVRKIFGRDLPGFFINLDPRGYSLKLEPESVPFPLHRDWGQYQILAPIID